MSVHHCVKAYRRPEGEAAFDRLVNWGFTFQIVRVMDVVAQAEVSAASGPVQEYCSEDEGRLLLRNVLTRIQIMVVLWFVWLVAASGRGSPDSIRSQSMCDFCWTKWHSDRFFS